MLISNNIQFNCDKSRKTQIRRAISTTQINNNHNNHDKAIIQVNLQ